MPWAGKQRAFYGTKAPTLAQRRARAVTFLLNCRTVEGVTVAQVARQFDLKAAVAAELLGREEARRAK